MRDKDDPKAIAMRHAVVRLARIACDIADEVGICQLCLVYNTASAAEQAEEEGLAHHLGEMPATHPPHKTVL